MAFTRAFLFGFLLPIVAQSQTKSESDYSFFFT